VSISNIFSVALRAVPMTCSSTVAVFNKRPRANTFDEMDEVIILLSMYISSMSTLYW